MKLPCDNVHLFAYRSSISKTGIIANDTASDIVGNIEDTITLIRYQNKLGFMLN